MKQLKELSWSSVVLSVNEEYERIEDVFRDLWLNFEMDDRELKYEKRMK